MKNLFKLAIAVFLMAILFTACDNSTSSTPPGPGPGNGPKPPEPKLLGININRAAQANPGTFIFGVNPLPEGGVDSYVVRKGGEIIPSSTSNANASVHVSGSDLAGSAIPTLSATARKEAENTSLATNLPGIRVYGAAGAMPGQSGATPVLEEMTDWLRFLKTGLEGLFVANEDAFNPFGTLYSRINTFMPNLTSEANATTYKDWTASGSPLQQVNAATAVILTNYTDVLEKLSPADQAIMREALPRLWLNSVVNAENLATMLPLVKSQFGTQFPNVQFN